MKTTGPAVVLKLEDVAVLVASLIAYAHLGSGWILFALLFLLPDVFMMGYAWDARLGAILYNAGHTYLSPLALAVSGWALALPELYPPALIWTAHISLDRVIGYGLKYAEGFKSTHVARL
jgi:hypothetical protein